MRNDRRKRNINRSVTKLCIRCDIEYRKRRRKAILRARKLQAKKCSDRFQTY